MLLWELVAENPRDNCFVGVPSVRYCEELKKGVRLSLPDSIDPEYAAITQACWRWQPSARPSAAEVVDVLRKVVDKLEK